MVRIVMALGILGLVAACDSGPEQPYFEFLGGGFIYNYRIGEMHYGFVVRARRTVPEGTILEARFENPAGGPRLVTRDVHQGRRLEYTFRSPSVRGVVKGRPYTAELVLIDAKSRRVIARYARTFKSSIDQTGLPRSATPKRAPAR